MPNPADFILDKNLGGVFLQRARKTPELVACVSPGDSAGRSKSLTYGQLYYQSHCVANGLFALGVSAGDRAVIYASSTAERAICDLAILGSGAISVPIHLQSTEDQLAALLRASRPGVAFVGGERLLERFILACARIPEALQPRSIVLIEPFGGKPADRLGDPRLCTLAALRDLGIERESAFVGKFEGLLRDTSPLAPFTLLFGSGDHSKGALLAHDNLISVVEDARGLLGRYLRLEERAFSALDPSSALARVEEFCAYAFGWTRLFAPSGVVPGMEQVRALSPSVLFTHPQIFECAFHEIQGTPAIDSAPAGRWSTLLGILRDNPLSELIRPDPLATMLGGRLRLAISGGASLAPEIAERCARAGIAVLEGYGLNETAGALSLNTPDFFRAGTVGRPLPEVAVRTSPDGELLVRSRKVFLGYFERPDLTDQTFEEGWLRTGDLGRLDAEGYLHVLGRKSDAIPVGEGLYASPDHIESLARTNPFFEHFVAFAGGSNGLAALITLRPEPVLDFARDHGILFSLYEDLVRHPRIIALAQRGVDDLNTKLSPEQRVRRFVILAQRFSIESGELTPAMNVCRPVVERKFRPFLDTLAPPPLPGPS